MKMLFITPCGNSLLAEIRTTSSPELRMFIKSTPWLSWKQMKDVNGKGCLQWYIVVDTSCNKEERLTTFARYMCEKENFIPASRICPHDGFYEDFIDYFEKYKY